MPLETIRELKVRFIDIGDIVLVPQPSKDQLNILKAINCNCVRREIDYAVTDPCQPHRELLALTLSSPSLAMVSDRFKREDLVDISLDSN